MELGYLLAFASGFSFALSDVLTRMASKHVERSMLVLVSLLVGAPYLWLTGVLVGEQIPPPGPALIFAAIGLIHFGVARYLFYTAITGLGASSAAVIVSPVIVLSSFLAWLLLGEDLTIGKVAGAILVALAVFLAADKPSGAPLQGVSRRKGLAAGLAATLIFSISSVAVRYAGASSGSPILGAAISYTAAIPVPLAMVGRSYKPGRLRGRGMFLAVLSALVVTSAQLFRYTALSMVPVVEALVFISLFPVHTAVLAAVLSGESGEKVRLVHAIAAGLAVLGIVLAIRY
ncbi:MAG: DMT family transporter [Desulfurococcales archaeon]|nr:DMT family transporter [Desulfurococcales archaeon]